MLIRRSRGGVCPAECRRGRRSPWWSSDPKEDRDASHRLADPPPRHPRLYQFSGSDSNLRTNDFENEDTVLISGLNAESAQNRGIANPGGLNDVAVYTRPGFTGNVACIRRGAGGNLRGGFARNIGSYEWVTRAACNRMLSALATRSPAA